MGIGRGKRAGVGLGGGTGCGEVERGGVEGSVREQWEGEGQIGFETGGES